MGANQRTAATTYSNLGAFEGENIGTGHGAPAQNDALWNAINGASAPNYRPQKNMSQIIWNAGFSSNAQWSATDGTGATGAGPGGSGNGPGIGGNNQEIAGTFSMSGGGQATAVVVLGLGNAISITDLVGGSGYSSATAVFSAPPSGTRATADVVVSGGSVTGLTNINNGSGYLEAPTITFSAPNDVNPILITTNNVAIEQDVAHTDYIYHPTTATSGIPIGGENILGSGTGWGGETPFDADENTQAQLYVKFTADSATPDPDDHILLKVGTYRNDNTYGTYKIHAEMDEPQVVGGWTGTSNEHGIVTGNAGSVQYWTGNIPNLNKFNGEPCTISSDAGPNVTAEGYVVTSNTSTGVVASVVVTDDGSGYSASEAVTITGTASTQTSCKGTVTVSGGGVTGVTITTPGAGYSSGRLYFTLASAGNTGRKYTVHQWECYVANPITSYDITKTPTTGNIISEDSVTCAASSIEIAGDYIDASITPVSWDFDYNGVSHVEDETTTGTGIAPFSYPASQVAGLTTVRAKMYIANTTPTWSHSATFSLTVVTTTFYIEEINKVIHPFTTKSGANNDVRTEVEGRLVGNTLNIVQNGDQTTNPFFLFTSFNYRIEATEPCTEFYIDWDDGDDNSPEKSNYQTIKLEEPSFYAEADHIFTTHGSHYPLVRAKSVDGYWSKYYTSFEDEGTYRTTLTANLLIGATSITVADRTGIADNDILRMGNEFVKVTAGGGNTGAGSFTVTRGMFTSVSKAFFISQKVYEAVGANQNDYSSLDAFDVGNGQNDFSLVSVDHVSTHKIPVLRPANLPPIAVLKSDRNRIYSGIQNGIFCDLDANVGVASQTVSLDVSGCSSTGADSVAVKITYTSTGASSDVMESGTIKTATITGAGNVAHVTKILKAELVNLKEVTATTAGALKAGERVYVKANSRVVCTLTLGNPIMKESDILNSAVLDLSESRTRASNVSISEYYIDDGHHITGSYRWHGIGTASPVTKQMQAAATTTSSLQTGDTLNSYFRTYYPSLQIQHSFQNELDPIGTDGRFLSKEILCRGQVKDSSSTTRKDSNSGDIIEYSYLDHDDDYNPTSPPRPPSIKSDHLILGCTTISSPAWVNLKVKNRCSIRADNQFLLGGGHHSTTSGKIAPASSGANSVNTPENFIFMSRRDKFDRIYMKTYNDYTGLTSGPTMSGTTTLPEIRISIYYPAKDNVGNVNWKPLPYKDSTKYENIKDSSLMKDGSLTFKPPLDWEKCTSADVHTDSWSAFGTNFNASGGGSVQPSDLWDVDSYGLLVGIAMNGSHDNITDFGLCFMKPYNNEHSQVLTLIDPAHVSLNTKTIAQSVSFTRSGIFSTMTSRLGKSDIRKISGNAGKVAFGGVDLTSDTTRKDMKEFQQNGTPVFLDVEHKNGDFTRFFGIIESMSEDHPTGKMTPKFGLSMIVSHIVEFDSSGVLLSNDYISLGGNVDYESEYIQ